MLRSTQLCMDVLDRKGFVPMPGLPNSRQGSGGSVQTIATMDRERSLALTNRIALIADSGQIPLPSASQEASLPDEDGTVTDQLLATAGSPIRSFLQDTSILDPIMASLVLKRLSVFLLSAVGPSNKPAIEAFAPLTDSKRPSTDIELNPASSNTAESLRVASLPIGKRSPLDLAAAATRRTSESTAPVDRDIGLPLTLLDGSSPSPVPGAMPMGGLPTPTSISRLAEVTIEGMGRQASLATFQTTPSYQPTAILEAMDSSVASNPGISGGWMVDKAQGSSIPLKSSSNQRHSIDRSYPTDLSAINLELQQRAVPLSPCFSSRKVSGDANLSQRFLGPPPFPSPKTSTSTDDVGRDHSSQVVNLTGAVMMDGRRLGRITASSQARDASLPARGPSRVNLRAVPIYSGMKIPS